jgi:hypothetical protein
MPDKPGFLRRMTLKAAAVAALAGGNKAQAAVPTFPDNPSPHVSTDTGDADHERTVPFGQDDNNDWVPLALVAGGVVAVGAAGVGGNYLLKRSKKKKSEPVSKEEQILKEDRVSEALSDLSNLKRVGFLPKTRHIILTFGSKYDPQTVQYKLEQNSAFSNSKMACTRLGKELFIAAENEPLRPEIIIPVLQEHKFVSKNDAEAAKKILNMYLETAVTWPLQPKVKRPKEELKIVPPKTSSDKPGVIQFEDSLCLRELALSADGMSATLTPRDTMQSIAISDLLEKSTYLKNKNAVLTKTGDNIIIDFGQKFDLGEFLNALIVAEVLGRSEAMDTRRLLDPTFFKQDNPPNQSR